jgi:transposase InsO family protein
VGDITYVTRETGFAYLALLTDAFSRFIVGFDLSISLAVEGCQRALSCALRQAPNSLAGLFTTVTTACSTQRTPTAIC